MDIPVIGNALIALGEDATEAMRGRVILAMGKASQSLEMEIRKAEAGSMLAFGRELLHASDREFVSFPRRRLTI